MRQPAEYVLGTLDAAERAGVDARRVREPALDAAIAAWEKRLAPLLADVRGVAPPADLFNRIETRLGLAGTGNVAGGGAAVISLLEARARRWRNLAVAASSLAACLMLAIGLRETVLAPQQQSYVAVFNNGDVLPAFTMTIDLASRQVTVRPVGAARQPGRTYQLWIASDQLGPGPALSRASRRRLRARQGAADILRACAVAARHLRRQPRARRRLADRPADEPRAAFQAGSRSTVGCNSEAYYTTASVHGTTVPVTRSSRPLDNVPLANT